MAQIPSITINASTVKVDAAYIYTCFECNTRFRIYLDKPLQHKNEGFIIEKDDYYDKFKKDVNLCKNCNREYKLRKLLN
jgi:hypothetical protein